jgi:hypothetical protein
VGGNHLVTFLCEVFDDKVILGIDHDGSRRNLDGHVVAAFAMPTRTHTAHAVSGSDVMPIGKRDQAVDAAPSDNDHAAAVPAVTTVGSTARNVLLASETHAAMATATTDRLDLDLVDKHLVS